MFLSFRHLLGWIISAFYSRQDLILENLALREQLLALHAKRPRHRLSASQKMFWVLLQRLWSGWKAPLVLLTPQTVVQWHRAGFRLYWKWLSRTRTGLWTQAHQPRASGAHLPHGCGKPNLGSTADSW